MAEGAGEIPDSRAQFQQDLVALQTKGVIRIEIPALDAFCLIGQLQLALRHPQNTGPTAQMTREFAERLILIAATTPALRAIAELGWDPNFDVRGEEVADGSG